MKEDINTLRVWNGLLATKIEAEKNILECDDTLSIPMQEFIRATHDLDQNLFDRYEKIIAEEDNFERLSLKVQLQLANQKIKSLLTTLPRFDLVSASLDQCLPDESESPTGDWVRFSDLKKALDESESPEDDLEEARRAL